MDIFGISDADGALTWLPVDPLPSGALVLEPPREIDTSALRLAGPAAKIEWATPVTGLTWGDNE